jgi:hypothetical protein
MSQVHVAASGRSSLPQKVLKRGERAVAINPHISSTSAHTRQSLLEATLKVSTALDAVAHLKEAHSFPINMRYFPRAYLSK